MWGALLGSESVCQPACKCAWKSQPSLGSLPRVIPTLSQQDFWSMAAREKALLTFRTMKMPCVHPARFPSSSAHLLLLAFPGANMIQLVVCSWECSCKLVRGRGGVGSPGDNLTCSGGSGAQPHLSRDTPEHSLRRQCAPQLVRSRPSVSLLFQQHLAFPKQPAGAQGHG